MVAEKPAKDFKGPLFFSAPYSLFNSGAGQGHHYCPWPSRSQGQSSRTHTCHK